MSNILSIAKNTFRQTIRDRVLYGILAFAILFLLSTTLFGSISLGEDIKVIKDFGLAGIYIFSIIIAIFLGVSLIHQEIEKKTVYVIFSKPVSPIQFILGKFFGLWISITLNIVLMSIIYLLIVRLNSGGWDWISLLSILLLIFELAIFISLTILFSSFTAPLAGTIYSIIILYIGHSLGLLKQYATKYGQAYRYFVDAIYYIFPNLEKFNIRNEIVHGVIPTSDQIIYPALYAILYSTILLWLATLAIKNQDY